MPKKILVVDDSESVRELVSLILEKAGYEVDRAFDGEDAVKFLDGRSFELVLTDINMPRMDGIGLIKEVRNKDQYKRTPIIVLTTESQASFKDLARMAGATGWIVKPFAADVLLSVINRVIR